MKAIVLTLKFISLCGLFINGLIYAQTSTFDSLLLKANTAKTKHEKVDALNNLAFHYKSINIDTALMYVDKSIELATDIRYKSGLAFAINQKGNIYLDAWNLNEAKKHYKQALEIRKELNSPIDVASSYANIGIVYHCLNAYDEAIMYYLNSLEVYKKENAKPQIVNTLRNMALLYSVQKGKKQKAIELYKEALSLSKEINDTRAEGFIYGDLGTVFKNKDTAMHYLKNALLIWQNLGNKKEESLTLNNVGQIYENLFNYVEAIKSYQQSIDISKQVNNKMLIASNYKSIGSIHDRCGNTTLALNYYRRAIEITKEIDFRTDIAEINYKIGIIYFNQEKFEEAEFQIKKAQDIYMKLKADEEVIRCNLALTRIYKKKGNFQKAIDGLNEILDLPLDQSTPYIQTSAWVELADINKIVGNYDYAVKFAEKALSSINKNQHLELQARIYSTLYIAYDSLKDESRALENFKKYATLNDSVFNKEQMILVQRIESKYYADKKQQELKKKEQELLINNLETSNQRLVFIVTTVLLIIVFLSIIRIKSNNRKSERRYLLKEIEMLKSIAIANNTALANQSIINGELDRDKIHNAISGTLNDSDWKILTILCKNPTMNNRKISEQVNLSFDGVRSSFKKMYRLFDIQNSNENQRMSLVIKAFRISNN
jgi:tetratricopeptide (TPR) repeat protein